MDIDLPETWRQLVKNLGLPYFSHLLTNIFIVCSMNFHLQLSSNCQISEIQSTEEPSGLEDVLPSSSVHEVKMATSWLIRLGVKAKEPAIIIGELKFTYGHLVIVSLGGDGWAALEFEAVQSL